MKVAVPRLYDAILQRLRKRVADNEFTQSQIGEALGIKQSAVSYLLKGKTKLTLEQFLVLSKLLGEAPHTLITEADASLTDQQPMPRAIEEVILKSPAHLLCYTAANLPVEPEALATSFIGLSQIKEALQDLLKAGVVMLKDGHYQLKNPHVTYVSTTAVGRQERTRVLGELHRICQQMYLRQIGNKPYMAERFNYYVMGYFTASQIREVEESLWQAYEKIKTIQRENAARHYNTAPERLKLWQGHMMLMTPLEEK